MSFKIDQQGCITDYTWQESNLVIPSKIDGISVKSLGEAAFNGCTSLTEINIPKSVTSIGWHAFFDCTNLTEIKIPAGLKSIGEGAFWGCVSLTTIKLPAGLKSIGEGAFWGCVSLTTIMVPPSVENIGESAYEDCTNLTEIKLPAGLKSIGKYAFEDCTSLTEMTLPDRLESIGVSAFYSCTSLIEINIPESVKSIGDSAFYNCTSLTKIKLPDGMKNIGYSTFEGCTSLKNATIPASVTSIGENAFEDCTNLQTINIPSSVVNIGEDIFKGCHALRFIIVDHELMRNRICGVLPENLRTKVITKAVYQHHLKEKQRLKLKVIHKYLSSLNRERSNRTMPNIFTESILPYLNREDLLDGKTTDLSTIIFKYIDLANIQQFLPQMLKTLEPMELLNAPRSHPASELEVSKYQLSQTSYENALTQAISQYECGYDQYARRMLMLSARFLTRYHLAGWMSEHRHDSATAQHAFDKQYGLLVPPSTPSNGKKRKRIITEGDHRAKCVRSLFSTKRKKKSTVLSIQKVSLTCLPR